MDEFPYQPLERRPIKARSWRVWNRLATALARHGVSANAISLAGMICGMLAGVALAITGLAHDDRLPGARPFFLLAAACVQLRLLANLLDGMVALAAGTASPVGELYNDVPDRVSDTAIFIGAGYAAGSEAVLGYLAACAALFTAYVRAIGKASGAAQEFCGPMAKQQRMFVLTMAALYLGLTPAAWQPAQEGWGLMAGALLVIIAGSTVTVVRRLGRIARHLRRTPS